MTILLIDASTAKRSRSGALLDAAKRHLLTQGASVRCLRVADLPADALLSGSAHDAAIRLALEQVLRADAVILATPVVQSAYSGLGKIFLDLLPLQALTGKVVLPLASGIGSQQGIALDRSLRPVLQDLAARRILQGVFAQDEQIALIPEGSAAVLHPQLVTRLHDALRELVDAVTPQAAVHSTTHSTAVLEKPGNNTFMAEAGRSCRGDTAPLNTTSEQHDFRGVQV